MTEEGKQSEKRVLTGEVIRTGPDKTVTVRVSRIKQHPKYKKTYSVEKNYLAHDKENQHQAGDRVAIRESRPRSKRKQWEVVEKLK